MVNSEDTAWHAGQSFWNGLATVGNSLNWRSIGFELVNLNTGKDPYPEAQIAAARRVGGLRVQEVEHPG